jgi:hydrogenase maturation protein HypF
VTPEAEREIPVQHHHAHLAACLGENRIQGPALGLILDGTGYGDDGTVWGGEILFGDAARCERAGHLLPVPLPGGEAAIREPWRHGTSLLIRAYGKSEGIERAIRIFPEEADRVPLVARILPASPITTSCGRLFDGVAAILGIGRRVSYEAQAAMELESVARGKGELPFDLFEEGARLVLDWRPALRALAERLGREPVPSLAAAFHGGLATALTDAAIRLAPRVGTKRIALSGGVWQNRRLLALTRARLLRRGLEPILHRQLPPNDECIGPGQTFVAAARIAVG